MKFKPQAISHFLNTRGGMALLWLIALAGTYAAMRGGFIAPLDGDGGLALPSANNWIRSSWLDWGLATLAYMGIALLAVAINRTFNVLRNMSMLFGGLFAIITCATPTIFGQFYGGTLICVIMPLCMFMLYGIYGAPWNTRTTFLIFFLMSLTTLVCRAAIFYLPILMLGALQMRVLNLRNGISMVLGIITPAWILVGMGIIPYTAFEWPSISYSPPRLLAAGGLPMIVTIGVTTMLGLLATLANLYRTLSYNTRTRAYNGFIAITLILTVVLMLIDFNDFLIYVPMLNLLTSIQLTHFFIWQNERISYIPILVIVAAYIALYIWNL